MPPPPRRHEAHLSPERLLDTLNVGFAGRIGSEVLEALDGVAASTGSGLLQRTPRAFARVPGDWCARKHLIEIFL